LDIAPFVKPGQQFRFVKVTDAKAGLSNSSDWPGADIDAVGARNSLPKGLLYSQKSHTLKLDGKVIASGASCYSGKDTGKNNPDMEDLKDVGPIPAGAYKIGKPRTFNGMPDSFDLTPIGHNAHGRTKFLIHGDYKEPSKQGTASIGCIIAPLAARKKIAESGVTNLRVVKE
jgi:hypothetical protein